MITTGRAHNPDSVMYSITMTATIGDWRRMKDQLESAYPSWRLASQITEVIAEAEKRFQASASEEAST